MAFTLSNVYRDEESQGGSIGLWIPDKDGNVKKVWWDENDFMDMFEKGDKKTKEILLDAMKGGRYPNEPLKYDTSEIKPEPIPQKPDLTRDEEKGLSLDDYFPKQTETPITEQGGVAPKSKEPQVAPEDNAQRKMMAKSIPSPYGAEGQERRQGVAVTPENFSDYEQQNRASFRDYMRKYDWLKTITPAEAAKRKIESGESGWFEEFAQNEGRAGMQFELIDDYKKNKDPDMREFMYEWQRFSTRNKEAIYDMTNQKFQRAMQEEKEETYQFEKATDEERQRVNEMIEQQEEEAEKYTPESRVKDMKALSKAKKGLTVATEEGNQPEIEALEAEIKLLNERLGNPEAGGVESAGLKNEDKMREHLKNKGMSPEQIETTLKEYAARKKNE